MNPYFARRLRLPRPRHLIRIGLLVGLTFLLILGLAALGLSPTARALVAVPVAAVIFTMIVRFAAPQLSLDTTADEGRASEKKDLIL